MPVLSLGHSVMDLADVDEPLEDVVGLRGPRLDRVVVLLGLTDAPATEHGEHDLASAPRPPIDRLVHRVGLGPELRPLTFGRHAPEAGALERAR